MPQLGTNRKKGTGSIRERSAGHYELRYYDKDDQRQAVQRSWRPVRNVAPASGPPAQRWPCSLPTLRLAGTSIPAMPKPSQRSTLSPNRAPGRLGKAPGRMAGALRVGWPCLHHPARLQHPPSASRLQSATWPCRLFVRGDVDRLYAHWRAEGMSQAGVVHPPPPGITRRAEPG